MMKSTEGMFEGMFRGASGQAFHNPRKRICERDILPSVYIVTVRDRFGKKPLFLHESAGRLLFARGRRRV